MPNAYAVIATNPAKSVLVAKLVSVAAYRTVKLKRSEVRSRLASSFFHSVIDFLLERCHSTDQFMFLKNEKPD